MKKAIMVAMLALAAVCKAPAQDVAGDWLGELPTAMGSVRIVLHVTKGADGALKATLDSPDQAVLGIPVDSITMEGSKLKFAANVVKWSYEGTVKNSSINGNWIQPHKMPQDFKKTTTTIKIEHPSAPPSDIDGTWEGVVNLPSLQDTPSRGKLALTFHIKNTGDGLTATMDVLDQNIKGWPAVAVIRKGSSITIEAPQLGGEVKGKLNKDLTVISGDWKSEQDITYALTLRRAKDAAETSKEAPAAAPAHN